MLVAIMTAGAYNAGNCPGVFLDKYADTVHAGDTVVSTTHLAPAVCWNYKRSDVYILENAGELLYGLSYPDSKSRFLTMDEFDEIQNSSIRKNGMVLLLNSKREKKFRSRLAQNGALYNSRSQNFYFYSY